MNGWMNEWMNECMKHLPRPRNMMWIIKGICTEQSPLWQSRYRMNEWMNEWSTYLDPGIWCGASRAYARTSPHCGSPGQARPPRGPSAGSSPGYTYTHHNFYMQWCGSVSFWYGSVSWKKLIRIRPKIEKYFILTFFSSDYRSFIHLAHSFYLSNHCCGYND